MKSLTLPKLTIAEMTWRPGGLSAALTCHLRGVDPARLGYFAVDLVTLLGLSALAQEQHLGGCDDPFAVLCRNTEDVYLVDPQGYGCARYLGRLTTKDAKAVIAANEDPPCPSPGYHQPGECEECDEYDEYRDRKPVLEFSGFDAMDDIMRMGYAGCKGKADIAFLADPNDHGLWQFDFVVDEIGLQVHFGGTAAGVTADATWSISMADSDISRTIGSKVADAILQFGLDASEDLSEPVLDEINAILSRFGMVRI